LSRSLEFLFQPESIAVVGASENPTTYGYAFMHHLLNYGYKGKLYPINTRQPEILGVKAYPSLDAVPGAIDYVIHLIGVNNAPEVLTQSARKGAKAVHILAGRASETGRPEGKRLEAEILQKAREHGIRVLGPNCLGVFCPKSGLSFGFDFPKEPGKVGALIQSGGNSTDLMHIAALRGIRFSKVVSYGNALDINEIDLFRYFIDDPETEIILSYIEGLRGSSREYLELLSRAAAKKPVVILKGGRTAVGSRIALSHTASLAGSTNLWETAIRQAGAVPVKNLDQMVNMAVAFSFLPPIKGKNAGIVGAGGGRSVLSADEWEENGFTVPPLPRDIRESLKRRGSQLWDWLDNPADISIMPGDPLTMTDVLGEIVKHPAFDFIAADAEEDPPFSREAFIQHLKEDMEGYIKISKQNFKPFLIIFDERSPGIDDMDSYIHRTRAELRTLLVKEGLPFFPSVAEAALALSELINYYRRRAEPKGRHFKRRRAADGRHRSRSDGRPQTAAHG
jgi:acyl-CoA synthetase (NDP forming)